ncbi:hypothetical protein OH76DRAFT_1299183, partial [Lentinus brumalis]
ILTFEVIEQLRADIKNTYLPSWLERPPGNFGSASHGKLKADHWRTVCTHGHHHMLSYLQGLWKLFEHKLVPNHHLSLHLASCLMLFGPVHGWWGYPFEHYNGIIQRLNTNNKIDEIPLTFMRLFCAAAELRWLIASTDWPETDEFRDMLEAFNRAYQDAARGTRVVDVLAAI